MCSHLAIILIRARSILTVLSDNYLPPFYTPQPKGGETEGFEVFDAGNGVKNLKFLISREATVFYFVRLS